jgi:predicted nucleic acid-binding Zn ribbon protein
MGSIIQLFAIILIGMGLLYFGYTLFFTHGIVLSLGRKGKKDKTDREGEAGAPRTCPVCSIKLLNGERVKSSAYPAMGKTDRLMNIFGCPYCLEGQRRRVCPVCGKTLNPEEFLIARLFDKPGRSHVHVLGCTLCRGVKSTPA